MSSSTAGRLALVKIGGTPTSFTAEAVTVLTANKKYQITNTAKQVWSPTATITVLNSATPVDPVADPYTINRLKGVVEFTNTTPRTVTVTGTYLPMLTVAKAKEVSYQHGNELLDDTTFDSNGREENIPGIKSISATLGKNWEATYAAIFTAAIINQTLMVVEIFHDRNVAADLAFWARPTKQTIDIATRSIIGEQLTFAGSHDVDLRVISLL